MLYRQETQTLLEHNGDVDADTDVDDCNDDDDKDSVF